MPDFSDAEFLNAELSTPELPDEEARRLAALHSLQVLDSEPGAAFQGLVEAAALACDLPISLITLIDAERQWCKAQKGFEDLSEMPRGQSFCNHTIQQDDLLEVPDATMDNRFADNPLVCDRDTIRFYAGVPLRLDSGHQVGALCVLGREPGKLAPRQRKLLYNLAAAAVQLLESHRLSLELATRKERLRALSEASPLGVFATDADGGCTYTNERWQMIFGLSNRAAAGTGWTRNLHPDDKADIIEEWQRTASLRLDFDMQFRILRENGKSNYVRAISRPMIDSSAQFVGHVGSVEDVTANVLLGKQLADQHQLLHVTMQSIGDAVVTADAQGRVTWLNPAAETLTGWRCSDARERPVEQIFRVIDEKTRAPAPNPVGRCLHTGVQAGLASGSVLISRTGEEFGVEDLAAPIRNARGELLGAVLVFHDVTEQRRLSGEMKHRATHDALTGLANRAEFEQRLQRTLNRSREQQSRNALMFIDLDQFKIVNDACGHSAGDQVLTQVAQLLRNTVRTGDTLARLGGDEFGVILEDCTSEQAQRVAQTLCDKVDDFRFVHGKQRFRIGTSIGLVPVDPRWASTAAILQAADTSCYAAKEAGRNRVHTWFDTDKAMHARREDMQWTTRLEQALDENRFVLEAQRIQSLKGPAHGLHAEVLIRLRDADGSLIAPTGFLAAAERFSLATRIDRWVLRHALGELARLPDLARVDMLSINVSGQSVGDRVFHGDAIALLTASGADICRRICLEITETAAVTNVTVATLFIEQARALGVRIALDDFGAGASSFGYLKSLKVDVLKIDGQFITDLIDDPLDDAAVRCFVDVARVMGLKTVAEFVDTQAILDHVRTIGIDYAQGYHLHEPEALTALLEAACKRVPLSV